MKCQCIGIRGLAVFTFDNITQNMKPKGITYSRIYRESERNMRVVCIWNRLSTFETPELMNTFASI